MGLLYRIIDRVFHHDKWAIGLVMLDWEQLKQGVLPQPVQWITPRFGQFIADPFLFSHNNKDYLLYELFSYASGYGKNVIAELVKDESGQYRLHNEQIIIDEPFHQSYPFVFSSNDTIYCLPEQAESNSLRLYRATDFPSTWVLDSVLIDNFPVVDPTLFRHDSNWWLFAVRGDEHQNSHLYAWYSKGLHGPWQPHAHNPIKSAPGKVRPAGPLYTFKDELYRPVQMSLKRYGDAGLLLERIHELSPVTFSEETVAHIVPFAEYPRGIHHLCVGKALTVVDGNCFASPLEVVTKFGGIIRRKFTFGNG